MRELGLLSLQKGRLITHLINVYHYLMGGNEEEGATIFSLLHSDRQWVETEAQ